MTPTIEDVQQDFKELNVYFNDLYHHGVNQVKDSGHLWIEFSDKFRAFEKRILAASLNRQGWTRVEDGKPEIGDSVLVFPHYRVFPFGRKEELRDDASDFTFWRWNEYWDDVEIVKDVTHWMPLPNKPII